MYLIIFAVSLFILPSSSYSNRFIHSKIIDETNSKTKDYSNCISENWFRLDKKTCIYLNDVKLNFKQSISFCKLKFNANRLTIESSEKQRSILNYLNNLKHLNDDLKIWIGLNRVNLNRQSVLLWDNELKLLNDYRLNGPNDNRSIIDQSNLVLNRSILKFDNRFRVNLVDSHFYLSNQTDKWRMSFSSQNRFHTICELPANEGNKEIETCLNHWQPIYIDQKIEKCIHFMQLNRASAESEIKGHCEKQLNLDLNRSANKDLLSNQHLNVDILRLNSDQELRTLIRLLEFEPHLDDAKWLIYLKNQSDFNHLFEHKPLIKNACYQLLSKRLIESKKIKRQIKNGYSEGSEFRRIKRGECTGECLDCLECEKSNEKISSEKSNNSKDDERKNRGNHNEKLMYEENEILSYFIHEFDCESSSIEFVICSYDIRTSSTSNNQTSNHLDKSKKKIEVNRTGHQRSLWKNSQSSDNLNIEKLSSTSLEGTKPVDLNIEKLSSTSLEGTKTVDLNSSDHKNQTVSNYLIAFDLLTKLQLVFISINLLFFIYLCLRLNQNQEKQKLNVLQPTLSTTHVHFDNFDNTLKFNQFDI